jgi:transposase InsO family protein
LKPFFESNVKLRIENFVLRQTLAAFLNRNAKPRFTNADRLAIVLLSRFYDIRQTFVLKPATFTRWHRLGFRLLWRWKSRLRGRPPIPENLQELIQDVIKDNPGIGQKQVANILRTRFDIRVSPRTVAKYWPTHMERGTGQPVGSQRWATFIRNEAKGIVACDFFTSVTATFRTLFVFVMMEVESRKIIHFNVTAHPTAEWTAQQFREALPGWHKYKYLIHDHGSMFTKQVDDVARSVGIEVKKTPVRTPQANAYCERLIGTIRRDCLDFLIPFGEQHLKRILSEWVPYYNHWRPHTGQHPEGVPRIPARIEPPPPPAINRHQITEGYEIEATPVLGGLRHRYRLKKVA